MNHINLTIKPHHLLDIFKLHGKGIETFVPDEKFRHDFYAIANAIMEYRINTITFTYGYDDICRPCICLKNNLCTDTFSYHNIVHNKNTYNEKLDKRLIHLLSLDTDHAYDFFEIIHLFHHKLNPELIHTVWEANSPEENKARYNDTRNGLDKYIQNLHNPS